MSAPENIFSNFGQDFLWKNINFVNRNPSMGRTYYYYIDRLKVFLMCLIIFHQTLIAYGGIGHWYYVSTDRFDGTALIVVNTVKTVNLSFLAAAFFLMSAMLARASYHRWGFREFVRRRVLRLGIPLAVYAFLFHPTVVFFVARMYGMPADWFTFWCYLMKHEFSLGPMWFIATLLTLELLYAVYERFCPSVEPLMAELWKQTPALRATLFVAIFGIISFIVRLFSPARASQPGIQWGFYPVYIGMFISGLIAQRNDWIHKLKIGFALPWLLFSLLCLPMLLLSVHYIEDWSAFTGGLNMQSLFYALWEPMISCGMCLFLMSVFFRYFNRPNKKAAMLGRLSYTVFCICPAVIVPFTRLFESMAMPVTLKWFFTAVFSIVGCFTAAFLLHKSFSLVQKAFKK